MPTRPRSSARPRCRCSTVAAMPNKPSLVRSMGEGKGGGARLRKPSGGRHLGAGGRPHPALPQAARGGGLDLEARILYRDGLVLIIDKPAGVAVHAGPSGGANLEQSFDALRFGLPKPPALAHRLDRDTS